MHIFLFCRTSTTRRTPGDFDDDSASRGLLVSLDGIPASSFSGSPSVSLVDASPFASASFPSEGLTVLPASPAAGGFVDGEVPSHSATKALFLGIALAFERATSKHLFLSSHSSLELESE